jgi:hypothetical protein
LRWDAAQGGELVAKGPQRCSGCGRRGCPRCLRVLEERTDDFFFDVLLCPDCIEQEKRR